MSLATRPVRFGALLRQADNRWESIAEAARICDDTGFHSIYFIDHLLAIPDPSGDILESWTTMTACAALTRRVRVSANVLCNSFRAPALVAKMAATLDVISGGAGEKRMLRLVAEEADVWNCSAGNYAQLDHKVAVLREHCRAVGRDPASLELSLQDLVVIAPTETTLRAPLDDARRRLSFFGDVEAIATVGTPDRCIDTLRRKVAQGITYFVCLFTDGGMSKTSFLAYTDARLTGFVTTGADPSAARTDTGFWTRRVDSRKEWRAFR